MRSYKTIERPAQVLGIDIQSLGLVFGTLIGGGLCVGLLGMLLPISSWVYLLLLLTAAGLYGGLKYLSRHRPPGFLMGYLSFHLHQPKRLTVGIYHAKNQTRQAGRA